MFDLSTIIYKIIDFTTNSQLGPILTFFLYLYHTHSHTLLPYHITHTLIKIILLSAITLSQTFFFMALFLFAIFILMPSLTNAYWPPSPGYWPSSKFQSLSFYKGFTNLWGPQHQTLEQNGLTIWLDRTSGSGFKSVRPFRSGYFGASIKLQPGYTAGVITAFYVRCGNMIYMFGLMTNSVKSKCI